MTRITITCCTYIFPHPIIWFSIRPAKLLLKKTGSIGHIEENMFSSWLHVYNAPPHRSLNNITAHIRHRPFETKQPEPPKSTNRSGRGHVYFFTLTSEIMSGKQKLYTRCTLQTKEGEKRRGEAEGQGEVKKKKKKTWRELRTSSRRPTTERPADLSVLGTVHP